MRKKSTFKRALAYIIPLAIFAAMLVWFLLAMKSTASSNRKRELEALKTTVENGITMCYAVEGVYPESMEYLCANYGLIYDKSKYIIFYDCFASNIRPSVTILERQGASEKV